VTVTNCVVRSYVATSLQTYKQINYCSYVKGVSVAVYSCKSSESKQKWNFKTPDLSILSWGAVSTGKKRLSAGEYY
jgi:hypothetical protein